MHSLVILLTTVVCTVQCHLDLSHKDCGISKYPDAGRSDTKGYVMGGTESRKHEFPWQVKLSRDGEFQCGGFLIDSHWVVTAEHCMESNDTEKDWTVWLGSQREDPPDGIEIKPKLLLRHPDYNEDTLEHDIAMFKLPQAVRFSDSVRPICLPELGRTYEQENIIIAGWGNNQTDGFFPNTLHHVTLPVMTNAECQRLAEEDKIYVTNICHGGDKVDAGEGDSGGAYMYKDNDGRFYAIGIVSYGYDPLGEPLNPGVGTRVTGYLDWIQQNRSKYGA